MTENQPEQHGEPTPPSPWSAAGAAGGQPPVPPPAQPQQQPPASQQEPQQHASQEQAPQQLTREQVLFGSAFILALRMGSFGMRSLLGSVCAKKLGCEKGSRAGFHG